MKKMLPVLAVLFLLGISSVYASDAATDVKSTSWGMNKEQVKRTLRKKPTTEEESFLIYRYAVFNTDCFVFYNFEQPQERLDELSYVFKPKSKGEADRVYSAMSAYLVKEYRLSENRGATNYLSSTVLKYESDVTSVTLTNTYRTNETVTVVYTDINKIKKSR